MANFKVGQRVRYTGIGVWIPRGAEGTVLIGRGYEPNANGVRNTTRYGVAIDGHRHLSADGLWAIQQRYLAPLTPPAEDTWAADKVRQVTKPQHVEPVVTKERV